MIKRKMYSKKAFSMITAIFVIVIMSSVSMLIMNVSGKTVKTTTVQYRKEQSQLLARSYTELAIFYVINYDRTVTPDCLETIRDHFGASGNQGYDILINIQYIGNSSLLNGCGKTITTWPSSPSLGFDDTISLVIDTFVSYIDPDDPSDRNITFHRRTLQKL